MLRALTLSMLIAATSGCAVAPTRIESTWLDPTYDGTAFDRVAVLALFGTESESRAFETQAVALLEERGIEAVPGHAFLAPDVRYTQEEMERELIAADIDGLLIHRLIAVDERRVYRQPTDYMRSLPPEIVWGDPFYWYYYPQWNYYWHWRSSLDVTRSPGYWTEYAFVTIESSLYDNETDQLVWTAKSETIDDVDFERLAASVADEVVERLVEIDLLDTEGEALVGQGALDEAVAAAALGTH